MADNTTLSAAVGTGDAIVTREISHAGDTAKLPGSFIMGITGTEGSYTAAAIGGDAANGIDVDVTRVSGTVIVDGSGVTQPVSHAALTELAAAINASSQMDVNIAAGSVTANAGTNLNTSALALESGGNLAGAATSLAVIDDWDETDRCKVNPIAGQAGVQGGSGAVSNTTQRVCLATDVALPAGTNAIGKLAANSGVDIGDVDVTSLPSLAAGTALIGKTAAGLNTGVIYNDTTALTPAYATIDTATSGDVTVVDPGAGKKVRVLAFNFVAVGTAVNVYFKTGSTAKFGSATRPIVLDKSGATGPGGFNSGFCPVGWFEGAADENLTINLSTAQGVVGTVVYVEI